LGQQASALNDANYVLQKLDIQNAKALFRRAHCYKTMNKWEEAMADLQVLLKENPSDEIKKDISHCLKNVVE
jgi:tetratricopeptide (TPR) repeat protein